MIRMHDGNCQPFNIDRATGKETHAPAWGLKNGQLFRADSPILGWRVMPFAYTADQVIAAGAFRPAYLKESPFGEGINVLPPAICQGWRMLRGKDGHLLRGSVLDGHHQAPHPDCTCGYRIVHDVKDMARFLHRHQHELAFSKIPDGARESTAIFAVRGLGLTTRSVEFKHFNDPIGTVRVQHVAAEAIVLLDSADAEAAERFRGMGFQTHAVDRLVHAHEASRCGSEYEVTRIEPTQEHALLLSEDPGMDGGTYFTRSGEWGAYGAAGALLKTRGKQPRYLLQQRSYDVSYGGLWSIPGGALHEHETPGQAAARELSEEMGVTNLDNLTVTGAVKLTSLDWTYQTVIAETVRRPKIRPNNEVAQTAWLTAAEIRALADRGELHPLFEASLGSLLSG